MASYTAPTSKNIWDFDPTSITGCILWLDAADTVTTLTSLGSAATPGDSVLTWTDKSRSANTATGVGISYATLSSTTPSTLTFTGSQYYTLPTTNLPSGVSDATYFIVSNTSQSALQTLFVHGTNATGQGRSLQYTASNQGSFSITGATSRAISSTATLTNLNLSTGVIDKYIQSGWLNGNPFSTTSIDLQPVLIGAFSTGTTTAIIGSDFTNASPLTGNIAEILVYNTNLSPIDRQIIEAYLANKWGFAGNLPSNHAFYDTVKPHSRNFIPTDIDGCITWLDPSDTKTVSTTSGLITSILDKSGSLNNFTNASSTITSGTISSLSALAGLSTGATNTLTGPSITRDQNNYSYFIVCQIPTGSATTFTQNFLSFGVHTFGLSSTTVSTTFTLRLNTNLNVLAGSSSTYTPTGWSAASLASNPIYGKPFLISAVRLGTTTLLGVNGNTGSSTILPIQPTSGSYSLTLGSLNILIGEVLIYNASLLPTERQIIEGYLLWKWGIRQTTAPVPTIPISHPYFKYPPPETTTPYIPILETYKKEFNLADLSPTIWIDSEDASTYTTVNNRITSIASKGFTTITFAPPNLAIALVIQTGTTVAVGGTGTITLSTAPYGIGTITNVTLTIATVATTGCTITGGSTIVTRTSTNNVANNAAVTANTYSVTIAPATTISSGSGTSYVMNLAPTVTTNVPTSAIVSGIQLMIGGVANPNCTITVGSTALTTSLPVIVGDNVIVQPGPLVNRSSRAAGIGRPYMDFSPGGNFQITNVAFPTYTSDAITVTATEIYTDGTTIVISSDPAVTLTVNQTIIFSGSGTVIPGTTNITAGTTYFIRSVNILSSTNTNFPTAGITISTTSGGTAITNLTVNPALSGVTAICGAYLATMTTSQAHRIPSGAPVVVFMDSLPLAETTLSGTYFGNVQSVPSSTTLIFYMTSNLTNIASQSVSQVAGCVQYGFNPLIAGNLASNGVDLTLTTAMPHNLSVGAVVQPNFSGSSLPSQWAPYSAVNVYSGTTTFTGSISGTTLTVTGGITLAVGAALSGTNVSNGTYVSGIINAGTSYLVSLSQTVTSTTITATYVSSGSFTGFISGTTLTYVSGTSPFAGCILSSGSGISPANYITSGSGPTFTIALSNTSGSAGSPVTFTFTSYSLEFTIPPSYPWPILPGALNTAIGNLNFLTITSWTATALTTSPTNSSGQGSVVHLLSAVGNIPAGIYYVVSSGSTTTLSASRSLSPLITPGSSGTGPVQANIFSNGSGTGTQLRIFAPGTSNISALHLATGFVTSIDIANRKFILSNFSAAAPSAGNVDISGIRHPGLMVGTFSGTTALAGLSSSYVNGLYQIASIPTPRTFTIRLNGKVFTSSISNIGSATASQLLNGTTYSGDMSHYGATDFRFGGESTGAYSYQRGLTQAYLMFPPIGSLLEASGTNITNAISSSATVTTCTVLAVLHNIFLPTKTITGANQTRYGPAILAASTAAGGDAGVNAADFSVRVNTTFNTNYNVRLINNNASTQIGFQTTSVFIDGNSGFRLVSALFNNTASAVGDILANNRFIAGTAWRADYIAGTFANNTAWANRSSGYTTRLAPTVFRIGGDTNITGYGLNAFGYWESGISELVVFNSPLTLDQRQLVEGYLSQKYNCQTYLAGGGNTPGVGTFFHPYRLNNPTTNSALTISTANNYATGLVNWFDASNSASITRDSNNRVSEWKSLGGIPNATTTTTHPWFQPLYSTDESSRPNIKFELIRYPITTGSVNASNGLTIVSTSIVPEINQVVIFTTAVSNLGAFSSWFIKSVETISSETGTYLITLGASLGSSTITTITQDASTNGSGNITRSSSVSHPVSYFMIPQLTTRVSGDNEFTMFTVYSRNGNTISGIVINYVLGGNNRLTTIENGSLSYIGALGQGISFGLTPQPNIPYIITFYRRGNRSFGRLVGNGTTITTNSTFLSTLISGLAPLQMGGFRGNTGSNGNSNFSGRIYEHILYKYAMSDSMIQQIESYLAWKWGIESSLPSTSPYQPVRP